MSFLTAEWRKLVIANYAIDQELLRPYLPVGTELDIWNDTCYVSLIGFLFKNTKLLGFSIPFHANFEEVNLRFYVKYKDGDTVKRGVVFIKEIVPKFALSVIANTVYHENYVTMPMSHRWSETDDEREIEYSWRCKNEWQVFTVKANKALSEILPGSEAEFITGHYWGYTKRNETQMNEYEVKHPKWAQYKVKSFKIAVNFADVFGPEFDCLNRQQPVSVMLAEGSDISVESKRKFRAKNPV